VPSLGNEENSLENISQFEALFEKTYATKQKKRKKSRFLDFEEKKTLKRKKN